MTPNSIIIYRFAKLASVIVFLVMLFVFGCLMNTTLRIPSLGYRLLSQMIVMMAMAPFLIASGALSFPVGKRRDGRRVVCVSESANQITINAGWPPLYLKAFITSMADRKGNAITVAREIRDAGNEAVGRANASGKSVWLTTPLSSKPSVRAWLERNGFSLTRTFPPFVNILTWIVFGPTIALCALFTGAICIGPWQTWSRQ